MEVLIKKARLRDRSEPVDIAIDENGIIAAIEPDLEVHSENTIDAEGCLVTPTFVDPHLHLDKVFTARDGRTSQSETLEEAIGLMHDFKEDYTVEDVKARAVKAIRSSVKYGCTKIRAQADVDTIGGLTPLRGILAAKEECKEIADIQVVAFPQEGILRDEGTEELLRESMDLGADVIGGMPASERSRETAQEHVNIVFEIAKKYDVDIDMHIDQSKDPSDQNLEYATLKSIRDGYQGRVTGGHCVSLAYQNDDYASKVIELLRKSDFNVCFNPQILAIMGIDSEPRTRGVTRVRELVDAGVNVAAAQDTICDQFHLYGTGDPLDYGLLAAYAAQYNSSEKAEIVYDMLTFNAAKVMRLSDYGVKVGNPADLNVIEAPNIREALRLRPSRSHVLKRGDIVSQTNEESDILSEKAKKV